MRTLLFSLVLVGSPSALHRPEPHIISQRTEMVTHQYESPTWERHIMTRNPLDRPVWVYIECERHLTVNPVGVGGHHTSEIVLPYVAPTEECSINHWEYQRRGQSPEPWRP